MDGDRREFDSFLQSLPERLSTEVQDLLASISPDLKQLFRRLLVVTPRLTSKQLDAVLTGLKHESPTLLRGPPGTGKTTTLIRLFWLESLNHDTATNQWLLVPYRHLAHLCRKKLDDLAARLGRTDLRQRLEVKTFHSFCLELLRGSTTGSGPCLLARHKPELDSNFLLLEARQSRKLAREVCRSCSSNLKLDRVDRYLTAAARYRRLLVKPARAAREASTDREFENSRFYRLYQQYKTERNRLDYTDVVYYLTELFRSASSVVAEIFADTSAILVDEFEQLERLKFTLLARIVENNPRLVAAGDYSVCRPYGSEAANSLGMFEFTFPAGRSVELQRNFRAKTHLFLVCREIDPVPGRRGADGAVKLPEPRPGRRKQSGSLVYGHGVTVFEAQNVEEEVSYLKHQLEWFLNRGEYEPQNIGLVVRYPLLGRYYKARIDPDSARLVLNFSDKFWDKPLPRATRLIFQLAAATVYETERAGVELADCLSELIDLAGLESPDNFEGVESNPRKFIFDRSAAGSSGRVRDFYQNLEKIVEGLCGPGRMLSGSEVVGLVSEGIMIKRSFTTAEKSELRRRLDRLGYGREVDSAEKLPRLFNRNDSGTMAERAASGGKVRVMTPGKLRGREFGVIFFPGFEEGVWPLAKSRAGPVETEVERERQLFYLGASRARSDLYLTYSLRRRFDDQVGWRQPSRFVQSISDELMEKRRADLPVFQRLRRFLTSASDFRP